LEVKGDSKRKKEGSANAYPKKTTKIEGRKREAQVTGNVQGRLTLRSIESHGKKKNS